MRAGDPNFFVTVAYALEVGAKTEILGWVPARVAKRTVSFSSMLPVNCFLSSARTLRASMTVYGIQLISFQRLSTERLTYCCVRPPYRDQKHCVEGAVWEGNYGTI